ncbi:PI-PLC domain-containing protein [Hellea balneolensis]|uniref:hypothetical protein n=1 Tax=Hellea balneolensis TaxID=287478 RepID=UPI0003FFB373|nr:hypothetical protein [Hellea balneolensis]
MTPEYILKVILLAMALLLAGCNDNYHYKAEGLSPYYYSVEQPKKCCTIIAHAGGAIDGNAYTNSREAIERNYAYGTRLFEIDFDITADGHWVAAHDWPNWKMQTGYKDELPPTRDDYMATPRKYKKVSWSIESEYNAVDVPWINRFLDKHPDAFIVTDMKKLEQFPDFVDAIIRSPKRDQFIFQAYSISDIDFIKSRDPNAKIILTMYRIGYPASLFTSLKEKRENLIGVTVPMSWAFIDSVTERLVETGLPIYLHGAPANINSRGLHADFAAKGISGFYLD